MRYQLDRERFQNVAQSIRSFTCYILCGIVENGGAAAVERRREKKNSGYSVLFGLCLSS